MKLYKASKRGYINYLLIIVFLFPFVFLYFDSSSFKHPFSMITLFLPFGLILWGYLNTKYKIENDHLYYKSAFLKGKIDIQNINELIIGKTMWSGVKPALATKGIIIKYNQFDEIYIAPENNEELVRDLLEIKPSIKS